MVILYGLLAALAAACVVGWRAESARAKAWQLDPQKRAPSTVKKFFAVGDGAWVVLGTSQETSFENVSANPDVTSDGFSLRGENGETVQVPKGTKVTIRALDGARRAPLDAITSGGQVKPRFSFEVPPDLALYMLDPDAKRSIGPYRGGAAAIVAANKALVVAGEPGALAGTVFPGCWLLVLFVFVGGGAIATAFELAAIGSIAAGLAALMVFVGWGALPEKPPQPDGPQS